ncbi:NAD(P)-dependent oxidoreductase [Xylocopilactobacillus apicola]|uniref:2-hydroxyacid dehydrogenase n=1 Tax=Xylocopilactobacillus apicola TaxID=2932184 RepID=A0AAU9D936_9LACO|nr:NAD(P)-dependent oxidoreductase [Xylocopilactobacillus apicola]BDR58916.1 2-hydroxyacid dehydrogenase [Xylocopilactobacillus apicola]
MKILVAAPKDIFDPLKIADEFKNNEFFRNNQFYDQTVSENELAQIEVMLGYDQKLLAKILSCPKSHLRWIQALSAGIDYLPLNEIKSNKISLTTLKGLHAEPIAETIIGMILGHYRALNYSARQKSWNKPSFISDTLIQKQVAIFGTGSIGEQTAKLLKAFQTKIIGINHNGHPAKNFDKTLSSESFLPDIKNVDIVVNTMPLTKFTENFFNRDFFDQLTAKPMFINVGRGQSTNTADLIQALNQKQISAAALDVTDPEPLFKDNPLWQMEQVLIMPHISAIYREYTADMLKVFAINLKHFKIDGNLPVNKIDLEKGY